MANPAPIISQINAFNATEGTIISFNIVGGTSIVRSNIIYIYDLSDNSLICTHLYISTESIHELPANTDPSIAYASGKSSADFTNGKQYYAQIQTFTNTAGTEGASGASIAKLFWCLVDPTLTINTIPSSISTTSYNVGAVYNSNTTATSNIVQQYQFNLYSATGVLVQSSGVITGSGAQQGTSTAYDLSYNFTGLNVGSSYYVTAEVTTTQGMTVSAQSNTFTVNIDTPTLGEATVVNNACDGYISVTSNLSSEYGGSASGEIASFVTSSVNDISSLKVTLAPIQDLHGYDKPWVGGAGKNKIDVADGTCTTTTTLVTKELTAGTYTFSAYGKRNDGGAWRVLVVDSNNVSIEAGANTSGSTLQRCYATFTLSATTTVKLQLQFLASYDTLQYERVQFEVGTLTDYAPYTNICSISGWDEVEMVVSGKNLCDNADALLDLGTGVTYSEENGYYFPRHYDTGVSHPIFVNEDGLTGQMTLSFKQKQSTTGQVKGYLFFTYTDGTFGRPSIYPSMENTWYSYSVTSDPSKVVANARYGYSSAGGDSWVKDIQVELGSTATDYEPYDGHTYTTDLPQTVYGGTLDVVSGVLTVDRAMVDLGTLSWARYTGDVSAFRANISDLKKYATGERPNIISSAYSVGIASNIQSNVLHNLPNGTMTTHSGYSLLLIRNDAYTDATAFKTAMSGVQLCYELATPRTIQLDPQTINTLVGVNNVWGDSGDVSVTYNIPITNLLVKRQDTADISGKWLTLYSQPITQASDMDFTFIDFLNQYGKTYKYALVPLLTQEQSGVEVEVEGGYTVSDEVVSIFDGVFVADNTAIYKLKAGVNYGDLSKVQEVGSINTIGSKYPIIVSNSKVDYRTASLSATIVADDYYDNGNLNRMDMVQKRELMESFFTNKRAKILKDWNGNIWLVVFIDNINITFINEYGMGIATLTATWTEIGDVTSGEDLQNTRIINVG